VGREKAGKSTEHDGLGRLSPPGNIALASAEDKPCSDFTALCPSLSTGDATEKLVVAQESTPSLVCRRIVALRYFPLSAPPQQTLVPEAFNFGLAQDTVAFSALAPQRDPCQRSGVGPHKQQPRNVLM
jgi:hypothetical protein